MADRGAPAGGLTASPPRLILGRMSLRDLFDAVRRAPPPPAGDGHARSRAGATLDLELFKKDSCPYCQRVFKTLARLEVPVRLRDIRGDADAVETLVRVGGKRQVPCLFVDGKPMYESADIVRFLEETFAA
jgi:glutaredoxin